MASAGIGAASMTGLTGLLVLLGGMGDATAQTGLLSGSVCATSGPIAGISDVSAANGRIVVAVSVARGGDRAALIALMTGLAESGLRVLSNPNDMTGLAESGLRVLSNPNDPSGDAYASDGVGGDHDSLGIFQQRPSWGTPAQRMEPVASTNLFLDRLLSLPNWQAAPPWQAAQSVQASAFADGSNYRAQGDRAISILNVVKADSAALDCGGSGIGQLPSGPVGQYGLPVGYTVPAGTSPAAVAAVTFALGELGKPYVFGANGPAAYDCSSLMVAAWVAGGHALTRTTYTQMRDGTATSESLLSPGDLVLTPGSDGTLASPGHVGMFIGRGLVVEAPHTGDVVKVVTYPSLTSREVSSLRHIA
ncbi:MAG: C40 family peptidase [Dermatophilaceae bacterium]